jgi:hypothetical protein
MHVRRINGKGFSLVEILVIVAVLGLIGVSSWLVYGHYRKSASINSNQTIIKLLPLGIQITVPNSLHDLTYTVLNNKHVAYDYQITADTIVGLSTKSLTAGAASCSASDEPLGEIGKVNGQYQFISQTLSGGTYTLIKQYPGYFLYYFSFDPDSVCSQSTRKEAAQQADVQAMAKLKLATAVQPLR